MKGTVLVVLGASLYMTGAQAVGSQAPNVSDVATWFQIVLGLIVALIGAYMRGLSERITDNKREMEGLRKELVQTQVKLAAEHHTKAEIGAQFSELKASLDALHRRLDHYPFPRVKEHEQ